MLHIEDRRENRLLVRKLLAAAGFQVTDAEDGLTGIQLAEELQPDLILVDINIPGLDGYEVVTRLRGIHELADAPIVAITAEGDRDRALAVGFDGFITKPIKMAGFADEVRAFLDGKRERIAENERAAHLEAQNRRTVERLEGKVRELTRANERLRDVDRLKMEVLRNVSHELATPMTPLVGYTKMLARGELGPLTEPQSNALGRMRISLDRLDGLIENLLNVTRFATGAVSLERDAVDVGAVVSDAVAHVRRAADARSVRFETPAPTRRGPVIADQMRVTEALIAVLDNAIKFGPEGGTVRIDLVEVEDGDADRRAIDFVVQDEGPGIPADQRDRVVEPFYQIDGSVTRRVGGAGLGMAVAERTVALHGGRLIIDDAAGGGARIALRIPCRPPPRFDPSR